MSKLHVSSIIGALACATAGHALAAAYQIDQAASRLEVLTGKAGMFSRAGHTHEILATQLSGTVEADPARPSAARLTLSVPPAGLQVQDADLSAADRATVQKNMAGDRTLDIARFARIRYLSKTVTATRAGEDWKVEIDGVLELHGINRAFHVPALVKLAGDRLVASGEVSLAQSDFGITPFRAVMGAVGVKNEVKVKFEIVANRAAPARR